MREASSVFFYSERGILACEGSQLGRERKKKGSSAEQGLFGCLHEIRKIARGELSYNAASRQLVAFSG